MRASLARLWPGREQAALNAHPYIYTSSVKNWEAKPKPGGIVDVITADNQWLGRGIAELSSNLSIRLYTRDES
jgi:23S rRNA G2069 N7-methylase RlmK/C1962 C5-methylase RlmI